MISQKTNSLLDKALNFLGYGDVKTAKILFICLEEHDSFTKEDLESLAEGFKICVVPSSGNTQIYYWICKIIVDLNTKNSTSLEDYKKEFLSQKHSLELQSNLYPLGKPSLKSWNKIYESDLNLSLQDYQDWLRINKEKRYLKLRSYKGKKLIDCF